MLSDIDYHLESCTEGDSTKSHLQEVIHTTSVKLPHSPVAQYLATVRNKTVIDSERVQGHYLPVISMVLGKGGMPSQIGPSWISGRKLAVGKWIN